MGKFLSNHFLKRIFNAPPTAPKISIGERPAICDGIEIFFGTFKVEQTL
tara:strand:+ start:105 stop:251 length:147 start_codon:yes stop_codon:yes gene_type:complete